MKLKLMFVAVAAALSGHLGRRGLVLGVVALELEKDAWAKLPKDVQALYVEKDGKYKLDGVEPPEDTKGLKTALESERTARKAADKAVKDLMAQWEGLDAKQIRDMLEKLGGDQEAQLIKAGKIDEVVALRTEKLRKEFEKQLQKSKDEVTAANGSRDKFTSLVLDNHVRAAAAKAGVHTGAVEDALFRARSIFKLDADGNAVQLDGEGKPVLGKDGKSPFTPEEWMGTMKEAAPHWFPATNTGSGAGGNTGKGAGAGGKQMKRSEFDKLTPEAKAATVKDKVAIVD
jgi:hypothetical protein